LAICSQIPCIIFPWAVGGDLWEFWRAEHPRDFLSCLKQIAGLTRALEAIHEVNCRHGDLKPANILYFNEGGSGILKIADLGIARAHTKPTFERADKTSTLASTRAYEGPEASENYISDTARSRRYDCWSMGCIIFEFVVWLLFDFEALESFESHRDPENYEYYRRRFVANPTEPWEMMEVHPKVYTAIDLVRNDERCTGTSLETLVNLVHEKLLKTNYKDRLCAACLHNSVQEIIERAQNDPSYLVKVVEPLPATPSIFSQPVVRPKRKSTSQ